MFLASMAKVSIPATSSPAVTFKVDPLITTGAPVNSEVKINVSIVADPGAAVVAWAVDVKVDPDVLKPGYYVTFPVPHWKVVSTSKAGYFLYDWCVATGWDPDPGSSPTMVKTGGRNETTGTITGYTESIKNWYEMPNQPGNGTDGTGTIATFHFTSLNETAWSPIEITAAYYFDSVEIPAPKRTADVTINGHYNEPIHDVAVTDVSAPAEATQGDIVTINADVANLGDPDETFNVKVSYDTTLVETQPVTLTSGNSTTIPFSWNTTDVPPDTYTITAEAILAGDVNLTNNEDTTTITVKPAPEHDIAIIDVVPPPILEVYLGDSVDIDVIVENEGDVEESFTLNLYAGVDLVGTENATLPAGANQTYTLTWTTTAIGNFTIKAEVPPVPDEVDTADNTWTTTLWRIAVIPEFPTLIPLLLALAVLAVSTIVLKRRQRKPSTSGSPTAQP